MHELFIAVSFECQCDGLVLVLDGVLGVRASYGEGVDALLQIEAAEVSRCDEHKLSPSVYVKFVSKDRIVLTAFNCCFTRSVLESASMD